MSAVALVATPYSSSRAVELGNQTWRKRLLPVGQVAYKGRMLNFTRDYLQELAAAFSDGAYDQIPFQLADSANAHTNDPERFRGEVTGMDIQPDGLYVTVRTTDAGSRLLETNPRLGVSARIVEEYDRSDGRHYAAAVQHVLGTLDPRILALGEWEPVDMSNGDDDAEYLIDLSNLTFAGEDAPQAAASPDDDGGHAAVVGSLRKLAGRLKVRHPQVGAGQHVEDAASALAIGLHAGAERHLRAAIGNLTPQSLRRSGVPDGDHAAAKRSMDEIHRHVLKVRELRDADDAVPGQDAAATGPALANDYDGYASGGYGHDPIGDAVELAAERASARMAEDSQPLARRSEDRLRTALERISRGTYTPTASERALGFAAGDYDADGDAGPFDCTCGAGISPNHYLGCGAVWDSNDTAELLRSGTYEAVAGMSAADSRGRFYADQHGAYMSMTGHIEAMTGQRLRRDSPFEDGLPRRDVTMPQREHVFGDLDDGDGVPQDFAPGTRQTAALAAAQAGIAPASASRERQRYAAQRDSALAHLALTRPARPPHPDYGESTRERAARMKRPIVPVQFNDELLPGELPVYTAG